MTQADRQALVAAQVPGWATHLLDLSFRNTLLNFQLRKTATLDLALAEQAARTDLLAGRQVRLSALFPVEAELAAARAQARNLARRIRLYDEEKGVDVGYLAIRVVSWTVTDSTGTRRQYRAPIVLCPLSISPRGATQEDFDLRLTGPAEPNTVLTHVLRRQHGVELDDDMLTLTDADPLTVQQHVEAALVGAAAGRLTGFGAQECLAAGVFSYEKLPIVTDLENAGTLLAEHDVIAGIAGDQEAVARLLTTAPLDSVPHPDSVPVDEEFLVLDADSSQREVVDAVLAGRHAVVQGPPGTGKSQTIANLIASLAARNKRVLFVAEKRAALDAVINRLRDAGLTELIFDLHAQTHDRGAIARQLAESLESARQVPAAEPGPLFQRLTARRTALTSYFAALHAKHAPWELSAYDVQDRLCGMGSGRSTDFRLRGDHLTGISGGAEPQLEEDLRRYVELGGLTLVPGASPWAGARVRSTDDVRQLVGLLDDLTTGGLPDARRALNELLDVTGLRRPSTVEDWHAVLTLLSDVARTAERHSGDIFDQPLEELAAACGSRRWRRERGIRSGFWQRRRARRTARGLRTDGERSRHRLHQDLAAALEQRDRWAALSVRGTGPLVPADLDQSWSAYRALHDQLTALGAVLVSARPTELSDDGAAETVRRLDADRATLYKLPQLHELRTRLAAAGLERLLAVLADRGADADEAAETFRWAWLRSILDEIELRSPTYATFQPADHDRLVADYRATDRAHQRLAADRIRRSTAEKLVNALNTHGEQAILIKKEAGRRARHLPLRRLVRLAPDILLAARPCWAMSPLVVSSALPALRLFDVVIFDEASQVRPADAIASIMRGRQLVVAGDESQLPPTNFFQTTLDTGELSDEDDSVDAFALEDYESILGVLSAFLPLHRLTWHYRSADERLIAFSNEHIYRDLVTFPGVIAERPISHVHVEGAVALPNQGGSAEEVQRVAQLALSHAERTPDLTLGIIAFGDNHAQRIEKAVWTALRQRPDLRPFFERPDDSQWQRYFVKNVENVQGDERDVIILAVGYGRRTGSGVAHAFGPLNRDGGERRLNVAVTRARRQMTVVSSFTAADLDPSRLRRRGASLLREFLDYAENGDAVLAAGPAASTTGLTPFEQDVVDRLTAAGLAPVPRYGVGGQRIDIALSHPVQPGRRILAVEADGRTYQSAATARDRDRLRQDHLERLGWRFHRIWSPGWFRDPQNETDKVVAAWKRAVTELDNPSEAEPVLRPAAEPTPPRPAPTRRLARPNLGRRKSVEDYTDGELIKVVRWVHSDGLLHDDEETIREVMAELGFTRRGGRIVERITGAIRAVDGDRR